MQKKVYFIIIVALLVLVFVLLGHGLASGQQPETENVITAHEVVVPEVIEVVYLVRDFEHENYLNRQINYLLNKYNERVNVPGFTYFGTFRITAYCSCVLCTEHYALDRPWVGNREIAITASGAVAEAGITIATDPRYVPWGTVLYIDGLGVRIAQDRGGGVRERHLDVFFGSHQEAVDWGNQHRTVWIVRSPS